MLAQTEAITRSVLREKVFLNILQNSQKNTCTRVSFWIKLQASGLQLYQTSDSDTGVFMWVLQYSKNTFFTDHLWATASVQIDPDKIVNYFFVKSCLRTVDQHYTGKFLVQFWLTHIKTTLYMVIFLRKDDYK